MLTASLLTFAKLPPSRSEVEGNCALGGISDPSSTLHRISHKVRYVYLHRSLPWTTVVSDSGVLSVIFVHLLSSLKHAHENTTHQEARVHWMLIQDAPREPYVNWCLLNGKYQFTHTTVIDAFESIIITVAVDSLKTLRTLIVVFTAPSPLPPTSAGNCDLKDLCAMLTVFGKPSKSWQFYADLNLYNHSITPSNRLDIVWLFVFSGQHIVWCLIGVNLLDRSSYKQTSVKPITFARPPLQFVFRIPINSK